MPTTKKIICLANSRKLNGRCIAGLEIGSGTPARWIRPVGAREHEGVSEYDRRYEDGTDPRVLDIINVPLLDPRPHTYQSENWLLNPEIYWGKVGHVSWSQLVPYAATPGPLWIVGHHTYAGLNDKIPTDEANTLSSSLHLAHVQTLTVRVFVPGAAFGNPKRRVQGRFEYSGFEYWLWITDPVIEREFLLKPDGDYPLQECLVTISLGEPKDGFVYKLIAAVILRP